MIKNIRNFAIIAHVDHGKSTLADRFLELTNTVAVSRLIPQYLDRLSLERERGITIKMQPVTMNYKGYVLNLIDTPGHVDFSYEVSRALAAVEGVILLIDGTQGIQAQTVANLELAKQQGLKIIPAINKIDLEIVDLEGLIEETRKITGENDVFLVSGKSGKGVPQLLEAIIENIPHPRENVDGEKCLIFDSHFDYYKGIIAHVRIFDGLFKKLDEVFLKQANHKFKILELGIFKPELQEKEYLETGMIGYIATGIKDPGILKIGDTLVKDLSVSPLPGYQEPKPNVFANIFPTEEVKFEAFRDSLNRLRLNDPALWIEPISNHILGRGYTVGALGLLHLEIFEQRLKQEFNTEIIVTLPSVEYLIELNDGQKILVKNPDNFPSREKIARIMEPIADVEIFTAILYLEPILSLVKNSRGDVKDVIYEEKIIKI
ncbi:MAG: GTP-binding protein, partial [Patescibacteria group bacterium]|nr:GTP-binding protein [Patescibacteria group bacterium]